MSELTDSFGRSVRYLRLSVTDRCNLRCTYCMAEDMVFLPRAKVLSLEELYLVSSAFVALGVEKIRLTGGEPLVRKGIIELAEKLGQLEGLSELVMTTNGVLLAKYAQALKNAGVRRLNISLDTLDAERFKNISRFGQLESVLTGIDAALDAGFEGIKLNAVILKGQNDDEVLTLARYAFERGLDISYIEEMPLGHIDSHERVVTTMTSAEIIEQLETEYALTAVETSLRTAGPSRYYRVGGVSSRVGLISPMTNNFCSSCNRVRVTTEGQLLLCLGNEDSLDLKRIIRDQKETGASEDAIKAVLQAAIKESMTRKPERHEFDPSEIKITRFMSVTGG